MDIKARIEEVINEKGLTKKEVAEKMGKFNQAFNSLLTNPKWETIELVAKALEMSTCEMLFGIKPEQPAPQPEASEQQSQQDQQAEQKQEQQSAADELPFDNDKGAEPSASVQGALTCPHCGGAFVVDVRATTKA